MNFRSYINTDRLFIIAAVFDTDDVSLLYRNGSAVDDLKTTPTGLNS
jgi:hypothetical protein